MIAKVKHKKLKRDVLILENERKVNRSDKSWFDLRTIKKLKLKAKDKLYEIKQKLHAK